MDTDMTTEDSKKKLHLQDGKLLSVWILLACACIWTGEHLRYVIFLFCDMFKCYCRNSLPAMKGACMLFLKYLWWQWQCSLDESQVKTKNATSYGSDLILNDQHCMWHTPRNATAVCFLTRADWIMKKVLC